MWSPLRSYRPLAIKLPRCLEPRLLPARFYNANPKSFNERPRAASSSRRESGPRKSTRPEQYAAEHHPKDTPEVIALKTQIVDDIHNSRINLVTVPRVLATYSLLVKEQTVLSRALSRQIIDWNCRALMRSNRLLSKEVSLTQDPIFQNERKQLQSMMDDFLAQYRQGRFQTDGYVTASILFHYNNNGEFDKALELWDWLCRMQEPGHLNYRGYAARIAIAERMGEGIDACEMLYQEALEKFGDPLVNYHLSYNAVLSEPARPLARKTFEAVPLLRSMFVVRLRNGDWKNAYLTLDTLLRINPDGLWSTAKFEVRSIQSAWEAFLIASLETNTASAKESNQSVSTEWLDKLFQPSIQPKDGEDIIPPRVYSIACTLLESIKRKISSSRTNDSSQEVVGKGFDYRELELLWNCWMKLYYWHGKDDMSSASRDIHGSSVMADFIRTTIKQMHIKDVNHLQLRIKKNLKLIQKLDGIPEFVGPSGIILTSLRQRISQIQQSNRKEDFGIAPSVPYWSSSLSREDMIRLYQELNLDSLNGDQAPDETLKQHVELSTDSSSVKDDHSKHPELIYEIRTGLEFAEARFRAWMTINNMFLVADAFQRNGCLQWQSMADELDAETASKQATVLEMLNSEDMSVEDKEKQKHILLNRLRQFRRHQGDLNMGI